MKNLILFSVASILLCFSSNINAQSIKKHKTQEGKYVRVIEEEVSLKEMKGRARDMQYELRALDQKKEMIQAKLDGLLEEINEAESMGVVIPEDPDMPGSRTVISGK